MALRKPTHITKIFQQNLKKPMLNVITRWNSTFDMIERLLELKQFCISNSGDDKELISDDKIWHFMQDFVTVFKPIKKTTLQQQN